MDKSSWIVIAILIPVITFLFAASVLCTSGVMFAGWKYVAVPVFDAPEMTFKQMLVAGLVLMVIASLFKTSTTKDE